MKFIDEPSFRRAFMIKGENTVQTTPTSDFGGLILTKQPVLFSERPRYFLRGKS